MPGVEPLENIFEFSGDEPVQVSVSFCHRPNASFTLENMGRNEWAYGCDIERCSLLLSFVSNHLIHQHPTLHTPSMIVTVPKMIRRHDTVRQVDSLLTVTESLPDISLETLLADAWLSEHWTLDDWISLMVQMIMLPVVNRDTTTVMEMSVHLDAYAVKQMCLAKSIDYGHLKTPASRFLLVKVRWDAPLPIESLDPRDAWTIVSQHAPLLGKITRHVKMVAREPSWPFFVRPFANETMELLSSVRSVDHVPREAREYAIQCIVALDKIINEGRDTLTNALLWEGGFNLGRHWLD